MDTTFPTADARRQRPRTACNALFWGGADSVTLTGRVLDASPGGLFLKTRKSVPVGGRVHLEFKLGSDALSVVGEVRWVANSEEVAERGLGIRILRLSSFDSQVLARLSH